MEYISYRAAEEKVLSWKESQDTSVFVIVFTDKTCENCQDFEQHTVEQIENTGIHVFMVDITDPEIAFPPTFTPTTFWYFSKETPPLIKKGVPPTKELLLDLLNKIIKISKGESTVEKEFF